MILASAALVLLTAAGPCAARGTVGYLRDWAICGPFSGTKVDEPPVAPGFVAYPGLYALGHVWLPVETEASGHLDLKALYPNSPHGTALLFTYFEAPADGVYHLRVGSDDAVRIEIDGRVVHRHDSHRAWQADVDNVRVPLSRGWHRMLVRIVDYGGSWELSVRLADERDQPLDVKHQVNPPEPFELDCKLDEPAPPEEQAETAQFLTAQATQVRTELEAALPRLADTPEGYVTFAEYESARNLGRMFFEAMAGLWREVTDVAWDETVADEDSKEAAAAARGFSEVLAQETERLGAALAESHSSWETLSADIVTRGECAEAALTIADLMARTRQLATRIEKKRFLVARLENDIRNFRQRDVLIRVFDAEGTPVPNAEVEVVQTASDFVFGCNLFALRRWDTAPKNALYEKRFLDLFNAATVPLFWSVAEKQRGRYDFAATDDAVGWCRDHHIQVKIHPILWQDTVPRWVEPLKADEARAAAQGYVRRVVDRYRDSADLWDALQQPAPAVKIGLASLDPADIIQWARNAKPRGQLLLNGDDARVLTDTARHIVCAPAQLDGVAITSHQHKGIWPPDLVQQTLNDAAAAGLPLYVSEVAILGGIDSEAEQAEAVRQFYTAAFAHPKVVGITWGDLSDQFAWQNAPAGLLRADLSPKPAYAALDRLINHLWRTDAAGHTGEDGQVAVRAFFGQYKITAQSGGRKITVDAHLAREGPAEVEIVLPPAK
jgi:GH35 family endo-1,4-beta-xylanase